MTNEIALEMANTILMQIKSMASHPFALATWGIEKRIPMTECNISTDKGVITSNAFGGGLQLDCINHTIGEEVFRLVRVRVVYNRVPDDYTIVITAPQMTEEVDSEKYFEVSKFSQLEAKGKPEKLLYSNHNDQGFYFDDLFRLIDGIIETGEYSPNYGNREE